MRLHSDVSVEMIQGAVCLFAAVPTALVHTLNLLITPAGTLVLLGTGYRDEGVHMLRI
jgi:hypothetical protein